MRKILTALAAALLLSGCCNTCGTSKPKERHFHAAGFDIPEGQKMRDFFDDFEEPMHAKYVGNDTVKWRYYVDYDREPDEGRIVRYCELDKYKGQKKLCTLDVAFYDLKVGNATSTCQ